MLLVYVSRCLFWAAAVQVLHPERFTTLVWAMDKYYGSGLTTSMNQSHMNQRSNIIEAIAKPWEDPLLWFATWLVVACHWALLWFCDLTCCGLQLGWKMKHFGLRRFSMHPMILREYVFVWVYLSLSCLALHPISVEPTRCFSFIPSVLSLLEIELFGIASNQVVLQAT